MPATPTFALWRGTTLILVVAAAATSEALMLHVGRRNPSGILLALFTIWVLSPFVALVWAQLVSHRWRAVPRRILYVSMVAIAVISPAIYADVALGPPRAQPAFLFLIVPLVAWVLIAIVMTLVRVLRTGPSGPGDRA